MSLRKNSNKNLKRKYHRSDANTETVNTGNNSTKVKRDDLLNGVLEEKYSVKSKPKWFTHELGLVNLNLITVGDRYTSTAPADTKFVGHSVIM